MLALISLLLVYFNTIRAFALPQFEEIACIISPTPENCFEWNEETGQEATIQSPTNTSANTAQQSRPEQNYTAVIAKIPGLQCNYVTTTTVGSQPTVLPVWYQSPGIGIIMTPVLGPNQTVSQDDPIPIPPPPNGDPPFPELVVNASTGLLVSNPPCVPQSNTTTTSDPYANWTYTDQLQRIPGLTCNSVTSTSLASGPTVLPIWLKSPGIGLISVPNLAPNTPFGSPPVPIKPPSGNYEPLEVQCGQIQGQSPPCNNPSATTPTSWTPVQTDVPGLSNNSVLNTTINCLDVSLPIYYNATNSANNALIMVPPVIAGAIVAGAGTYAALAGSLPAGVEPLTVVNGELEPFADPNKQPEEPDKPEEPEEEDEPIALEYEFFEFPLLDLSSNDQAAGEAIANATLAALGFSSQQPMGSGGGSVVPVNIHNQTQPLGDETTPNGAACVACK